MLPFVVSFLRKPDPVKGAPSKDLKGWRDSPRLALLNLKYDAMPAGEQDCSLTQHHPCMLHGTFFSKQLCMAVSAHVLLPPVDTNLPPFRR